MLTTTEAATVAAVASSTIKRWADQGLLPFSRTAGGHRRFDRYAVERIIRAQPSSSAEGDPVAAAWIRCLVDGRRHEIDGRLLGARGRLGSWYRVADELALALAEMGRQWERGELTIAEEHAASDALARALSRMGDALPSGLDGPRCLLACVDGDEHTLGLSLAELCVREVGWTPLWLGRRTPIAELIRLVGGGRIALVVLTASAASANRAALARTARQMGAACKVRGAGLVLGGSGDWPARPASGVRLDSFTAFHEHLAQQREQP